MLIPLRLRLKSSGLVKNLSLSVAAYQKFAFQATQLTRAQGSFTEVMPLNYFLLPSSSLALSPAFWVCPSLAFQVSLVPFWTYRANVQVCLLFPSSKFFQSDLCFFVRLVGWQCCWYEAAQHCWRFRPNLFPFNSQERIHYCPDVQLCLNSMTPLSLLQGGPPLPILWLYLFLHQPI